LQIFINGEAQDVQESCSVQQLLQSMDISGKRLAVEVNEEIVPKSRHAEYAFCEGDRVEIVHAIGGG
jgi:sulfur carrier protein